MCKDCNWEEFADECEQIAKTYDPGMVNGELRLDFAVAQQLARLFRSIKNRVLAEGHVTKAMTLALKGTRENMKKLLKV